MSTLTSRDVKFLVSAPNTTGDGNIDWIGFEAKAESSEETKKFIWWRNYTDTMENLNTFCRLLHEQKEIEALVGPGIDLHKSIHTKTVNYINETDKGIPVYGVYIESSRRPMFNFMIMLEGLDFSDEFE